MKKKPIYELGDRVSFMSSDDYTILKTVRHFVGYVKQIRKTIWGLKYVLILAKSDEIRIVPERDVFGKVERKDTRKDAATPVKSPAES